MGSVHSFCSFAFKMENLLLPLAFLQQAGGSGFFQWETEAHSPGVRDAHGYQDSHYFLTELGSNRKVLLFCLHYFNWLFTYVHKRIFFSS